MAAHYKKHSINNVDDHIGVLGAVTGNLVEFNSDGLFADSGAKISDYALTGHTHVAANITDFDVEVSNNVDVAANTSARHDQNSDLYLDFGNVNQVSASELRSHLDNANAHDATDIDTDTTNFNNILSSSDDTLQKALDTLDNFSVSAVTWGTITGTLSNQTDLQNALNGKADVNHTHVEADITDLDKYTQLEVDNLLDAQDELSEMNDVTITAVADDEVLTYDIGSGKWINETLAEAGIADVNHTHAINDLTDVVISTPADNEVVAYDSGSGNFINQTLAEASISAVGHTHVASDISDFDTEVSNNTDVNANTNARHDQNSDLYLDFGNANQVSASEIRTFIDSKGQPSGLATLDAGGKVPLAQIPAIAITDVYVVATIVLRDALTVQTGDVAKVTDAGSGYPETYIYNGTAWVDIQESSDVISVNSKTGVVVLDTDDINEGSTNLYYTDARVSANTDVTNNTTNSHVQNTDTQLRSGLVDSSAIGELKIKVFRQATQPVLSTVDFMALWVDTSSANQTFLMFKESAGNDLLVELA